MWRLLPAAAHDEGLVLGIRLRGLIGLGSAALATSLCAIELAAELFGTRTISLRNIHTDDVVTVEYKRNGRYVPEAMNRINWVMRDWRRDEQTTMDPKLVDLLWDIHRELGSKEPINLISAYRSRTTNNMLRTTRGGQASESRHILGKAADVHFPDVPVKHARYAALVREQGGVGYYPTSATPFVHVDTDRVRAWPRVPRFELALLFPSGRSLHKPAEGGDLTTDDVASARARQPEVATQLAAFHDLRRRGRNQPSVMAALAPGAANPVFTPDPKAVRTAVPPPQPITIAALPQATPPPPPPRLVTEPRLADRPLRLSPRPSEDDRRTLTQLVALAGIPEISAGPVLVSAPRPATRPAQNAKHKGGADDTSAATSLQAFPRLVFLTPEGADTLKGWSTGFVPAPAWDEDHPEEAAYRPFPLAPFLTETASIDDPALTKLVHPDLSRTGEFFDETGRTEHLKLRPAREAARAMWNEASAGDITRLAAGAENGVPRPTAARRVTTETKR